MNCQLAYEQTKSHDTLLNSKCIYLTALKTILGQFWHSNEAKRIVLAL